MYYVFFFMLNIVIFCFKIVKFILVCEIVLFWGFSGSGSGWIVKDMSKVYFCGLLFKNIREIVSCKGEFVI